ncbi:MAG TPA: ABC transporter substrate-binding protein [Acidimicrobiales bacterium]|nr:ABC transporter substrate-binding protein [Acidimicrobiales bacterium]
MTATTALAVGLLAAACSNNSTPSGTGTTGTTGGSGTHVIPSSAPGVTNSSITVGSLTTASGALAAQFAQITDGVQAYFDAVNAQGGVDGRTINLADNADDTGSPTNDTTQARNLVEQDHVFAVVGVGTPFFSGANFLASSGTPAFGYVVTQDWNNHPNLFGAYGSYLQYSTSQPAEVYVAKQLHATSVGVMAYSIAASSEDACKSVVAGLKQAGIHVGFEDVAFGYGANPTADVLAMKAAHVDLTISCMEGSDNLAVIQAMRQNGMTGFHAIWLNGYNRDYLTQDPADMVNVIYFEQHVPFEVATQFPGKYPAMDQYIATMKKYEPKWTYDDLAFQGYLNAVQFVQGLKEQAATGKPLTQADLIATINKEKAFTGGLTTPVNWTNAHTSALPPYCAAFVQVETGDVLKVVFTQANDEVFVCGGNNDQLVSPLPGTPGL